jgi:hypothetical protein
MAFAFGSNPAALRAVADVSHKRVKRRVSATRCIAAVCVLISYERHLRAALAVERSQHAWGLDTWTASLEPQGNAFRPCFFRLTAACTRF